MTDPYDLLQEFADVLDDAWEGDPAPTFEQRCVTLNVLGAEVRCEQSIRALRNLDARKAGLTAELDRLKAKLNAVENRREEVRNYLRGVMVAMGTRKVKTTIATASISAGRERIVLAEDKDLGLCVSTWPFDIVAAAVEYPPPKVSKTVLQREFGDRLKGLAGVSLEVGDDILVIR